MLERAVTHDGANNDAYKEKRPHEVSVVKATAGGACRKNAEKRSS